ncbi:PDZ and LIM domain protein Zasp-like isoform X4 [Crassostrea angulata]|nr:PDZ and LIM domain protein Zasp-like isoform X4 [Crassostrea angulata]
MASVLTLEAKLERVDPTTPWGFRMQGGKEFGIPLTILKVNQGSLAAKCGLQQGDIILKIGSQETTNHKHKEAQDLIIGSGNKLDLLLQRIREKKSNNNRGAPAPQHTYEKFATPSFNSYSSPSGAPQAGSQNYNTAAKPFGSPAPRPDVDAVTQQTSQLSFAPKPAAVPAAPPPPPPMQGQGPGFYSATPPPPPPAQTQGPGFYSAAQKYADNEEKPTFAQHQSRSFKFLQGMMDSGQDIPAKPEPSPPWRDQPSTPKAPPAPAQSSAPKPGVWTPPAAPTAKPFTPNVQPPAPAAPGGPKMGPPRNPTGVNAVRAKKGEATIFKSGDSVPGITRIPVCSSCSISIRGPFVVALGKTWCPDHFVCQNPRCGQKLLDIGFVEEGGFLYCEKDYEQYFAPTCTKCGKPIVGECVNALQKTYHPVCFICYQCKQPIGGNQFHLEDGNPYCENDWRQMFQTMCKGCDFPIEPGDHWVEAMGNNFHSECFNCSTCGVNLEGQPFFAKGGKPYCKKHTR